MISEDHMIALKPARKILYPQLQQGFDEDGTSGVTTSLGTGGGVLAEVSVAAAEINGLAMDTGDELYWYIDKDDPDWADFDLTHDVHGQVKFESKKTGATAGVDFTLAMKGCSGAEALTDAKSTPDALITFPAAAATAPGVPSKTTEGAFGFTAAQLALLAADEFVLVAVTLADKGDAAADDIVLLSVVLTGTRSICHSTGIRQLT